jgi:hypothetical protein
MTRKRPTPLGGKKRGKIFSLLRASKFSNELLFPTHWYLEAIDGEKNRSKRPVRSRLTTADLKMDEKSAPR